MAGYRELKVWREGVRLSLEIYKVTSGYPVDERFGLVSQLRRAAVSVPSNIAEGHARNTPQEMIRFCGIALGSLAEIETQLTIAKELGFADKNALDNLLALTDPLSRMLHGLVRSSRTKHC